MRRPGDVIFLLDLWSCRGDRKGAAALLRREVVERLEVVPRHADHLGARFLEVADRRAEGMRFGSAAAGEGLGEEIEDYRPVLQLLGEMQLELLAADGAGRVEVGRLGAGLERSICGNSDEGCGGDCEYELTHERSPLEPLLTAAVSKVRASVRPACRRRSSARPCRTGNLARSRRTRSGWSKVSLRPPRRRSARRIAAYSMETTTRRLIGGAFRAADGRGKRALPRSS